MRLEFDINIRDFLLFYMLKFLYLWPFRVVSFFYLFFIFFVEMKYGYNDNEIPINIIFYDSFAAYFSSEIICAFLFFISEILSKKLMDFGEKFVEIEGDFLIVTSIFYSIKFKFIAIDKIKKYGNFISIKTAGDYEIIIPSRFFPSEVEKNKFISAVREVSKKGPVTNENHSS